MSLESGAPIPDERLEAVPIAERTVEEEERFRGGAPDVGEPAVDDPAVDRGYRPER